MKEYTALMDLHQLSGVHDFIVVADEQLTITWASRSVLETVEDAVGTPVGEIFEGSEPGTNFTLPFLSKNIGTRLELSLKAQSTPPRLVGQWIQSDSSFVLLADRSDDQQPIIELVTSHEEPTTSTPTKNLTTVLRDRNESIKDAKTRAAERKRSSMISDNLLGNRDFCCDLMDTLPDFIFVLDKNAVIQTVNRVYPGHSIEQVVGKSFLNYVSLKDHLPFLDALHRAISENTLQTLETEVMLPDGRHNFLNRLKPMTDSEENAAVLIATDISELRHAQKRLSENEAKFRSVFHGVAEGLLVAETETRRFTMANDSICQMLGYSEEEIIQLDVRAIHPHETQKRLGKTFVKMLAGEIDIATNIPVVRKDGSRFLADISAAPITISGKQLLLGCFRDVTERQKLRANLAEADRFASIGTLASGVAHELNNPLSYVNYDLEIIGEELPRIGAALKPDRWRLPDSAPPAKILDDIQLRFGNVLEGVRKINTIVQALSTFSRLDKTESIPVDIAEIIDQTASMAFNEIKYRAHLVKDYSTIPLVLASEGRLSQVFLNLLINAAQAIDEGAVEQNEICVRTWTEDHFVCAEIKDTGSGIRPEYLPRIFDPFFSTKEVGSGSGLGLSIARNIVESYGGTIAGKSEWGQGSRFVVRLPSHGGQKEQPETPSKMAVSNQKQPGRVLLVDDEKLVCQAVKRMLQPNEVVAANSGREAKSILENDQDFDVIICDVMMDDVSGIDLHQWLAAQNSRLAAGIVFVSGGVFTSRARQYLETLDNIRLDKPLDVGEFVQIVTDRVQSNKNTMAQ